MTMITISQAVRDILQADELAQKTLQLGLLNLSAYAKKIHSQVEAITHKEVQQNTIVVALSRQVTKPTTFKPLTHTVELDSLNIISPLRELTFEKTTTTSEELSTITTKDQNKEFLTITSGVTEITVICSPDVYQKVINSVNTPPKKELINLVAVTVGFSDKYIPIPNTIYSLLSYLAPKRINVLEIVSTYTELTFIIDQSELDTTIACLKPYLS